MCASENPASSPLVHWVRTACILEASARKPGNVHPEASFADLTHRHLIDSAAAIAPLLGQTRQRGVGRTIFDAVSATRAIVGGNPNLGIVLLLAPLSAVPLEIPVFEGIGDVLRGLSVADAREAFAAIRLASPGGLGTVPDQDVSQEPSVTLLDAMRLAADRDSIARQYANEFDDVLHYGLEHLALELDFVDRWETSIIRLQLKLMAQLPDSLIARKCGRAVAEEASLRARTVLEADWPDYEISREILREFDDWLRADGNRRNPGATADLIVACLFAGFREGIITPPPRENLPC